MAADKTAAFRILMGRMTSIRTRYASNQGIHGDLEAYEIVNELYGPGTIDTRLPGEVIRRDRELEQTRDRGLQYHRWHWTLDPLNKARVSIGEYALVVERPRGVIYTDAQGYEYDLHGGPPRMYRTR